MGRLNRLIYQPQYSWVESIDKPLHSCVPTISSHNVLGQVIGANAEEINVLCHPVGYDGCGRRFDHYANFHCTIILPGHIKFSRCLVLLRIPAAN
jgi:hypothetical protein